MKKNVIFRIAAIVLMCTLVTACFASSTFAKYTSQSNAANATARVAKWAWKVNNQTLDAVTFNLFDTIKDSDRTSTETNVAAANGTDKVIAPGTSGSFDLVLTNNSEVDATYAIDFTVTNATPVPIEFSIDGGTTWTSTLADIDADDDDLVAKNGGTKTVTVDWRWDFDDNGAGTNDTRDTNLGKAGTATVTVTAQLTVTQVD